MPRVPAHHAPTRRPRRRGGRERQGDSAHALSFPIVLARSFCRSSAVTRHFDIVERQRTLADHLILLVALSGHHHDVARARLLDGAIDRFGAIDDRQPRRAFTGATG